MKQSWCWAAPATPAAGWCSSSRPAAGRCGLAVTPSTEPLTLRPLALVPTVAVPLAIALHTVTLIRLRTAAGPTEDHAGHLVAGAG